MEYLTSSFTPFYRHIGGIQILGSKMSHIQTSITLLICAEKILNLCSNSRSRRLLSKRFRLRLQILYCSNIIVKTVNKGPFVAHFLSK